LIIKDLEVTAFSFDNSGRRLITGGRDGVIKVNNNIKIF